MAWTKKWEAGVRSDWENAYLENRCVDLNLNIDTPFAISRLNRNLSLSEDVISDDELSEATCINTYCNKYTENDKRFVSKMPLATFRQCLINHFDIRFQKSDIVWPRRLKRPNLV